MSKKIKKEKFSILAVGEMNGKTVFYCCSSDENEPGLFLMEKTGSDFRKIYRAGVFSENGQSESLEGCSGFRFFHSGKDWYLVYSREYSRFFFKRKEAVVARSSDMISFDVIDREDNWKIEAFASVSRHSHKNNFLAYFGGNSIRVAASNNLKNWHFSGNLISPRAGEFDSGKLHVLDALTVKRGILVLYVSDDGKKKNSVLKIGGALFSKEHPYKLVWRSQQPLLEKKIVKNFSPKRYLGCLADGESLDLYWSTKDGGFVSEKITLVTSGVGSVKKRPIHLDRHHSNPILTPKAENYWEYDSTFNPAAVHLEDKIHLIYRAIGANGVSVFGYASSKDGFAVSERLEKPAFAAMDFSKYSKNDQALHPSKYVSGGSWIGCEDPRITRIEDRIYMTYTSFDGWNPPGVAITWISVKDFLRKKWTWKRPILISKPGEIQKNWMLFPEKINGKYAILHSITPQIAIEYVDDFEKEGFFIESVKKPGKDEHRWDNYVRGAGSPPIRTEHGWLVLYHAMDKKDPNRYKVGAMILDYKNPTKILYRSSCPILEPDMHYENEGAKAGVVYVCGAVIKDGTLFVYYGGADSVVCVATADIREFLKDLSCDVANDPVISRKARGIKRVIKGMKTGAFKKAISGKKIKKKTSRKKAIQEKTPKKKASKPKSVARKTTSKKAKRKKRPVSNKKIKKK